MIKALRFLNLLDAEGNLSISNVAAIVCVTKLAITATVSGADAVALISVLLNYAHKRYVNDANS